MSARRPVEEELQLVARAKAGDRDAEAQLVIDHLLPAFAIVNRYVRRASIPKEDLEQEAALAVLTAVRRFDPTRGVRLVTYALWWVRVRVQRACRSWRYLGQEPVGDGARWIENVPGAEPAPPGDGIDLGVLRQLNPRRRGAVERVLGLNGHEPHTRPELAAALGVRVGTANKVYSRALAQLRELVPRPHRAA